jgi:hypothetical protein
MTTTPTPRPLTTHPTDDLRPAAGLAVARWARPHAGNPAALVVDDGPRPVPMAHSVQTGDALVSIGTLGADLIRVGAGTGFAPHTHPGDHLLLVVRGRGTITLAGRVYPTFPGDVYVVPGREPHAVGAIDDHVLIAVGSPHRAIDDPDRMTVVDYAAVAAALGDLHCLVCDRAATVPRALHDVGCPHCPCLACSSSLRDG